MKTRGIMPEDKSIWSVLWAGYLRFYRHRMDERVTQATFERLIDPNGSLHGLVAIDGLGQIVGFAHYLFHATSWSSADLCYLEDLFVDPASRGGGAGRALIVATYAIADQRKAAGVYWMTQEFNADGRALYDTIARRTSFIRYER